MGLTASVLLGLVRVSLFDCLNSNPNELRQSNSSPAAMHVALRVAASGYQKKCARMRVPVWMGKEEHDREFAFAQAR